MLQSLPERLRSKITVNSSTNCWEWQGARTSDGYGWVWINGKSCRVHREVYRRLIGEFDAGLLVLHLCDNRKCCNPAHLQLGTHQDNMEDMRNKGRSSKPKGEAHGNTVLSEVILTEIRLRRGAGETCRALAKVYKVSHQYISAICRNTRRSS